MYSESIRGEEPALKVSEQLLLEDIAMAIEPDECLTLRGALGVGEDTALKRLVHPQHREVDTVHIVELLVCVAKDLDATLIMVTYDALAASKADRVLRLRDGRLTPTEGIGSCALVQP